METIAKNPRLAQRLVELETESKNLIDEYLRLVSIDANSPVIKTLRNRLKELRTEQWQLLK